MAETIVVPPITPIVADVADQRPRDVRQVPPDVAPPDPVTAPKPDPVNHPHHYEGRGMEAIDVIEAFDLDFCLGNTVKYVLRAGKKDNEMQDLRKAIWYLQRRIQQLEKK